MVTELQLKAESWWGREIVPAPLAALGAALCRRYSRPADAAGTKGDTAHLSGSHRSQEWIGNSKYCTNRVYTVQPGLVGEQPRHVAGLDFTPGSGALMVELCRRIDKAVRSGMLEEVREFYGNVDGDLIVDGWNNVLDRAASSDSSHLWHFHLSIDRRLCDRLDVMEKIYTAVTGETMALTTTDLQNVSKAVWELYRVIDGINMQDTMAYIKHGVQQLLARPLIAEEQVAAVAAELVAAVVAAPDNPLSETDVQALLAVVEPFLAALAEKQRAEVRDAVADLGEGGAAQVRADAEQ